MDNTKPKPIKLTAEECCEQLLTDPALKQVMLGLLELLNELKIKPSWYHGKSYKCNYKGGCILFINFNEPNRLGIRVCAVNNYNELERFLEALPDDLKAHYMEYLNTFERCCKSGSGCGMCQKRIKYYVTNPTMKQFETIKRLMFARMEFIKMLKGQKK